MGKALLSDPTPPADPPVPSAWGSFRLAGRHVTARSVTPPLPLHPPHPTRPLHPPQPPRPLHPPHTPPVCSSLCDLGAGCTTKLEELVTLLPDGRKAEDITPSIAWRREAKTLPAGAQSQEHHTIDRLEERGEDTT